MYVNDITFLDYVNLKDRKEVDFILKYGKLEPFDYFKIGDFIEQSFGFVKDMQDMLTYDGMTWEKFFKEMSIFTGSKVEKLALISLYDLQRSRLFIKSEVEKINKIENDSLGYAPTSKEISAGIEMFSKYRSFIQFDKLANGDITKFDEIRKIPYSVCFTKLLLLSDTNKYNENMTK